MLYWNLGSQGAICYTTSATQDPCTRYAIVVVQCSADGYNTAISCNLPHTSACGCCTLYYNNYYYPDSFVVDTKSQAVNTLPLHEMTSSSETHTPREWATSFISEQQELDSTVADLLTAFPFQHSTDGRFLKQTIYSTLRYYNYSHTFAKKTHHEKISACVSKLGQIGFVLEDS